eukprot:5462228-Prymnesium_polylepis.1
MAGLIGPAKMSGSRDQHPCATMDGTCAYRSAGVPVDSSRRCEARGGVGCRVSPPAPVRG